MGLLNTLIGASSQVDALKHDPDLHNYLLDDEQVEIAFKLIRDYVAFTPRRIILVNKQGVSGKKKEYQSIPYSKVLMFSAECKGMLEMEAELRIFIMGKTDPVVLKFGDNDSLCAVQRGLTLLVCK